MAAKKITRCPICNMEHIAEMREENKEITIKNEVVIYNEKYLFCDNAVNNNHKYFTKKLERENQKRALNTYRRKKGLLTSEEIVDLRKEYNLSQVELAKMMGWGEATISRYESNCIQDISYDIMLREIRDNPLQALKFLEINKDKFCDEKYIELKNIIIEKFNQYGWKYLIKQLVTGICLEHKTTAEKSVEYDLESLDNVDISIMDNDENRNNEIIEKIVENLKVYIKK